MSDAPQRDWRSEYLVCEHVADGTAELPGIFVLGFRACCAECYKIQDGEGVPRMIYTDSDNIVTEKRGELTVYRLRNQEEKQA